MVAEAPYVGAGLLRINVPAPVLFKLAAPFVPPVRMLPLKVVVPVAAETISEPGFAVLLLRTEAVAPPANEPTVSLLPFKSSVAPEATVTAEALGIPLLTGSP